MPYNKYHVASSKATRTYDGITFDSAMEMKYYRDVLLPAVQSGDIICYELQKKYVLLPSFEHGGKTIRSVTYVADFFICYKDRHEAVIDIKGYADPVALIKRKMFWFNYPDVDYRWLTYSKKYGGWIDYDDLKMKRSIS